MLSSCLSDCFTRDKSRWVEDGPKAWSIVLGSFFAHFSVLGLLYSFGIFVVPISQEFGVERSQAALIGTINLALFFVSGIFTGALSDRYGVRPVMSIGALLWIVGCISASFATSYGVLLFTQGILIGTGCGAVYFPAVTVLPQWFKKYRGTAVGLAVLGSGIGNLIFALAGNFIVINLGWRNTLRAFAGFGGVLIIVAILLLERRVPPLASKNNKGGLFFVARKLIRLRSYQWFLVASFFFQWGFFLPYVHLAAFAKDLGFASEFQGLAIALLGAGSSVGRLVVGPMADYFGRMKVYRACLFANALCFAFWPLSVTEPQLLSFAFFYAFFGGAFIALNPVIAGDYWGVANLGGTFALANLVMIPGALAAGPVAGMIYDKVGSYDAAIWFGASCILLAAVSMCLVTPPPPVTTDSTSTSIPPQQQQVNPDLEQNLGDVDDAVAKKPVPFQNV